MARICLKYDKELNFVFFQGLSSDLIMPHGAVLGSSFLPYRKGNLHLNMLTDNLFMDSHHFKL